MDTISGNGEGTSSNIGNTDESSRQAGDPSGNTDKIEHDPLGGADANPLPINDSKRARESVRYHDGKATTKARDAMYTDLADVGESGEQGERVGREDQNTVQGTRR